MRYLLTGGSACGKSTYAERLICTFDMPRYYIATMRPYGEEAFLRIDRHRKMRAERGFETVEKYTALHEIVLPKRGAALLECMCNLTANEMFDDAGNFRDPYDDILRAIESLENQCEHLVVVTNDVGSDVSPEGEGTLAYVEMLGRLNRALAGRFENVYELVCGIPVLLKGELPCGL